MTEELRQDIQRRVAAVQRRYHEGGRVLRAVWVAAALVVIVVGLAMIVLPGPAVIVLPVGLAMLAARFDWAQRVLRTGIDRGVHVQRRLARQKWLPAAAWTVVVVLAAAYLVLR